SRGVASVFSGSNGEGSTDSDAPLPAQEGIPPRSLYNDNNDLPFQPDDFGNNGCQTNARDLVKCLEQNNNDINS
ncbi:17051_t:CDS:2, partial [Dentiscutata erythropus]